jgi:hypothetical protein
MKHILYGVEAVCTLTGGEGIDVLVDDAKNKRLTLEVVKVDDLKLDEMLDKAIFWEGYDFITQEHYDVLVPYSTSTSSTSVGVDY